MIHAHTHTKATSERKKNIYNEIIFLFFVIRSPPHCLTLSYVLFFLCTIFEKFKFKLSFFKNKAPGHFHFKKNELYNSLCINFRWLLHFALIIFMCARGLLVDASLCASFTAKRHIFDSMICRHEQ